MNDPKENPTPSEQEPLQPGKKKPWMIGGKRVFPKSRVAVLLLLLAGIMQLFYRERVWHDRFIGGEYDKVFTIGTIVLVVGVILFAIKKRDDQREQAEQEEEQGEKKELE